MKTEYLINFSFVYYPLRKRINKCEYYWADGKWLPVGLISNRWSNEERIITEEEAFRYILEN